MGGYKTFYDGTVLAAADVNGYLMDQSVQVVNESSKNPVPTHGMFNYVADADRLEVWDGSAWVRIATGSETGRTGCLLRRSSNQSISNSSITSVSWDTETADTDGFIAVTSSTVTIPSGLAGLYHITAVHSLDTIPTTHMMRIIAGGNNYDFHGGGGSGRIAASIMVPLAGADTLATQCYQSSGGSANLTGYLYCYRVSR